MNEGSFCCGDDGFDLFPNRWTLKSHMNFFNIKKIVSGGQTGADRAGLNFAIKYNIPHGGYCPKGRRSEDGVIPARYKLIETTFAGYLPRNRMNVQHSDATLIFSFTPESLSPGSKYTLQQCQKYFKPYWLLNPREKRECVLKIFCLLRDPAISVLNVAGSRDPAVGALAYDVLCTAYETAKLLPE